MCPGDSSPEHQYIWPSRKPKWRKCSGDFCARCQSAGWYQRQRRNGLVLRVAAIGQSEEECRQRMEPVLRKIYDRLPGDGSLWRKRGRLTGSTPWSGLLREQRKKTGDRRSGPPAAWWPQWLGEVAGIVPPISRGDGSSCGWKRPLSAGDSSRCGGPAGISRHGRVAGKPWPSAVGRLFKLISGLAVGPLPAGFPHTRTPLGS